MTFLLIHGKCSHAVSSLKASFYEFKRSTILVAILQLNFVRCNRVFYANRCISYPFSWWDIDDWAAPAQIWQQFSVLGLK